MSLPHDPWHRCQDPRWPEVPCQPPWHLYGWLTPASVPAWQAVRAQLALEQVLRFGEHPSPVDLWVHERLTEAQMGEAWRAIYSGVSPHQQKETTR